MSQVIFRGQRGFTLIELLAVMAIIGILAGLVAGAIVGLGSQGQSARLSGDADSMNKAANRFFLEAFPEKYPVVSLDDTDASLKPDTDLGVRILDFKATLPQDPTKRFVPDFLNKIPDSSALVEWRIDTNSGEVFFVNAGSLLIKPSNNVLDIEAADRELEVASDHTFTLTMGKNEAGLKILKVKVPAGYSMAGRFTKTGTLLGVLSVTVATDNDDDPGNTIVYGGVLLSTADANEFDLVVNYNDSISSSGDGTAGNGNVVEYKHINLDPNDADDPADDFLRVHTVSLTPPSGDSGGELKLVMDRGDDGEQNEASEIWTLTIFGEADMELSSLMSATTGLSTSARDIDIDAGYSVKDATESSNTGTALSSAAQIITTPDTDSVYRWLAEEHTAISPVVGDTEFFSDVPGSLGVLIKAGSTSATSSSEEETTTANTAPVALDQDVVGNLLSGNTLDAAIEILLTGFDADDDDLTFTLAELPVFGILEESEGSGALDTISPLTGPTVFYSLKSTATLTATGTDVFTFQVADADDISNLGTVDITFTEDATFP